MFRYVDKVSGEQVNGVGSFIGRLRDVDSGEDVAQLRCSWCENGDIEVVFPDMGVGRYVIVIDHSGLNGEITRFLDGFAGYLEPRYAIDEYLGGEDVVVTVCCGDGAHEVYALSGDLLKYSTLEAIEAMKAAEAARDAVLDKLDLAMEFVASFNEALQKCVQVVNNYLWIGGVNTGHYLKGDAGETPRYGSDGWWYIGDERVGKARGDDGITPHITSDGYWAFGSQKTNVRAAGKDGINGAAMRRVVIDSVIDLPQEEERGVYYYVRQGDGTFEVYVWLENAGWTSIGPANDVAALNLATDRVHGMVKFSAGEQEQGAPVGWQKGEEGTAIVPLAGTAVAGTGKLGSSVVISFGAPVGMNSAGAYYVGAATTNAYGAIKLSTDETLTFDASEENAPGAPVGLDAAGAAWVPWATTSRGGAVRLGSYLSEVNSRPYLVSIGHTSSKQLAFNVLTNGAMKHAQGRTGWTSGMAPGVNLSALSGNSIYFGLDTTIQFSQEGGRLSLNEASTTLCAGVRLARSMQDDEAAAVLTAPIVRTWVMGYAPSKSEVYTISQSDARFLTTTRADSLYLRKEDVGDYAVKNGADSETTIYRMTKAQFDALSSRDGNGIYFIKRS